MKLVNLSWNPAKFMYNIRNFNYTQVCNINNAPLRFIKSKYRESFESQLKSFRRVWIYKMQLKMFQFSSVAQLCLTLCDPMDCSTLGFPVYHQLPELTQTHVHRVGDATQLSHLLSSPSSLTFNLSQHQGFFQWVSSSHQVAKILEFQLQHQAFQWIIRTDFL